MKFILFVLTFSLLNFSALAEEETPVTKETQAGWFSPGCTKCPKILIPGPANLGNSKGVFRPGDKSKFKKKKAAVSK